MIKILKVSVFLSVSAMILSTRTRDLSMVALLIDSPGLFMKLYRISSRMFFVWVYVSSLSSSEITDLWAGASLPLLTPAFEGSK